MQGCLIANLEELKFVTSVFISILWMKGSQKSRLINPVERVGQRLTGFELLSYTIYKQWILRVHWVTFWAPCTNMSRKYCFDLHWVPFLSILGSIWKTSHSFHHENLAKKPCLISIDNIFGTFFEHHLLTLAESRALVSIGYHLLWARLIVRVRLIWLKIFRTWK